MADKIETHENLEVWRRCEQLVTDIYELTTQFPIEERFELARQMKRSAISVTSNIAEGAARPSTKEYIKFLGYSRGSLTELQSQVKIARTLQLAKVEERLFIEMIVIKRMINSLMRNLRAKLIEKH